MKSVWKGVKGLGKRQGQEDLSPLNRMILTLLKSLGSERRDYFAHLTMCVDIFDCDNWGRECFWHLVGRGQG